MALKSSKGTVYELIGDDTRPTITLVHGLGLTRDTFTDYVPELARHYRVLNYDLTGHGESAAPLAAPSVSLFADQLRDLLDELNIQSTAIIGFSLGGMINRRFAMDYPDRASALIILNSPHDRGEEAQRLVEKRAADTQAGGPGATLDATIERWFTPAFRQNNPETIEKIRQWVLANDPETYAKCRMVLATGVKELIRPNPPITHPTLVMTCEHDTGSTPKMSHDIASEISGSRTVIIPELQHMGLVEQPELFLEQILNFLADQKI